MHRHPAHRQGGLAWLGHLVLAALVVLSAKPASAQALYGTLVGNVVDDQGARIPGATVTVTRTETNQVSEQVTPENGTYSFPNLLPGTYQVVVTLPGFKTFAVNEIALRIGAIVRVDARLEVGALEESVTVSGAAPVLQADSATLQSLTTSEALVSIPITGRSYQSMLALTPGVAQPDFFQVGGINNPARTMRVTVNGQPNTNTTFRLDGMTVTNQWIPGLQAYGPAIEAIETVNVVTSNFEADQGMAGGAAVNVQVKSGTNSLRGSAFEYFSNSAMRARNFFLPPTADKPKGTKNIFGGTLGGRILRDKLFFFGSIETTDSREVGGPFIGSSALLLSLPPTEFRGGNFSTTGTPIYDPLTGNANGTGRVPFAFANCPGVTSTTDPRFAACNFIPTGRLSPAAQRLLAYLPAPTGSGNVNNYVSAPAVHLAVPQDRHQIHLCAEQPDERQPAGQRPARQHELRRALRRRQPAQPRHRPEREDPQLLAVDHRHHHSRPSSSTWSAARPSPAPTSSPTASGSAGPTRSASPTPARRATGRCRRWRSTASRSVAAPRAARSRSATTASARRCSTTTTRSSRSSPTPPGPRARTTSSSVPTCTGST